MLPGLLVRPLRCLHLLRLEVLPCRSLLCRALLWEWKCDLCGLCRPAHALNDCLDGPLGQ